MKKYYLLALLLGFFCFNLKPEMDPKENTELQENIFPEREPTTIETIKEEPSINFNYAQKETEIKNDQINGNIEAIPAEYKPREINQLFTDQRKKLTIYLNNAKKDSDEYYCYLHYLNQLNQNEHEFKSHEHSIDIKEVENYLEKHFTYDKYQRRGGWNLPNRAAEIMNDSVKEMGRYVDLRYIKTKSDINKYVQEIKKYCNNELLKNLVKVIDNEGDALAAKFDNIIQREKPELEKMIDQKTDEVIEKFKTSMNQEIQDFEKKMLSVGKKSFFFLFYFGLTGICFFTAYQTIQKQLHTHFDKKKKSKLKKLGLTICSFISFCATVFSMSKSYEVLKNFDR